MAANPKDPNSEEVIGKLCVLEYEMEVTEGLLTALAKTGSEGLDSLFDFSVPYSTTLLSSIPAFFNQEVDFPIIVDQVLGTIYKHPSKWKQLKELVRNDSGTVTLYVCPVTGVPKILSSEETFEVNVNGLTVRMTAAGLSKLCRITHQDVDQAAASLALEYIADIGFIGAMIEDMNEFAENLFTVISTSQDETFVDFFQELILSKSVTLNMNVETGTYEVNLADGSEGEEGGVWSSSDEQTLQEILDEESSLFAEGDDFVDEMVLDPDEGYDDFGYLRFGEFNVREEDLKNKRSTYVKGNDSRH